MKLNSFAMRGPAGSAGPALWTFGGPVDGKQPEVWEREAEAVAGCIARIKAEGWTVSDRGPSGRVSRQVEYEDICVLTPSRTNLRRLERAFEVRDIPYRIESGEINRNPQVPCSRSLTISRSPIVCPRNPSA